jgi:hypothetical protein
MPRRLFCIVMALALLLLGAGPSPYAARWRPAIV